MFSLPHWYEISLNLWHPLLPCGYSCRVSCAVICNFWHWALWCSGQSAPMSKNYKWRLSPVWHRMLITVPTWQQWASKGFNSKQAACVQCSCVLETAAARRCKGSIFVACFAYTNAVAVCNNAGPLHGELSAAVDVVLPSIQLSTPGVHEWSVGVWASRWQRETTAANEAE